jgi:RNA polymerase sigma-70 factor (ECF subfamily)
VSESGQSKFPKKIPGINDQATQFEDLVTPQLDAMLRTAQRLTKDANDAEDLVQDTMLKGLRFFDRFQPDSNFKAWIFKILMNAFVNSYRKKKRQGPTVDMEIAAEIVAEEPLDPSSEVGLELPQRQEAIFEQIDERIKQALLDLPEHLRIVFMLNVLEDLKYREISEILDCPVGTVMSRLFRARGMLKERLAHFAELARTTNTTGKRP